MGWYSAVGRRAFFALPPETSHRIAVALLGLRLPWRRIGGAASDLRQAVTLAGIPLRNPIGLAAGFDKSCAHLDALGSLGFGYVVGGTITHHPRGGSSKPRIARDRKTAALVNSMGLPNAGAEAVARQLARTSRTAPRLVSLADEQVEDVLAASALVEPLVDGLELNASSPNAGWQHRADHVGEILAALRPTTAKPIIVKLPRFEDEEVREAVLAMAIAARDHGADALTCCNTRPVASPRLAAGRGGLSGKPLIERLPDIVRDVRVATGGRLPINASGGVFTAQDALVCIEAGATTVQIYTSLVFRGPGVVGELTRGLRELLADRDSTVPALVGTFKAAG